MASAMLFVLYVYAGVVVVGCIGLTVLLLYGLSAGKHLR
jgi:hypothetical protein